MPEEGYVIKLQVIIALEGYEGLTSVLDRLWFILITDKMAVLIE
jgi:hypothetical protein